MRLYSFELHDAPRLGVALQDGKQVLDLAEAAPRLPQNSVEFIRTFSSSVAVVDELL